jgi:hypothetical protein
MKAMNKAKAKDLAQSELTKTTQRRKDWRNISFHPLRLKYETDVFWVFMAVSPDLQAQGYVPGAIHFTIDKKDGHIWNDEEIEEYNKAKFAACELQAA